MGTPLTGSSVASTYTGLLKTSDNAALTSVLKAVGDGSGIDSALQLSTTAVNASGDFSVGANKLTVAAASGNTVVGGTLTVTGATSLSGNLAIPGNLSVTGTSTLTGATSVVSTLAVTGATSLSSVSTSGAAVVGTTLNVTGATTLGTAGVTTANISTLNVSGLTTVAELDNLGDSTVGGTLDVTGATTLGGLTVAGNLVANGNTTIGNAGTDLLTINANVVTLPNLTNVTVDLANDNVLITDFSDSSRLKSIAANALGINSSNAPQSVQQVLDTSVEIVPSSTSFGTEITGLTTTITPRSATSKVLITVTVCYGCLNSYSVYSSFRLSRGAVELGSPASWGTTRQHGIANAGYSEGTSSGYPNVRTFSFLDSPGTASAVTYKINIFSTVGSSAGSVFINRAYDDSDNSNYSRSISTMTLQEYFA